MPTEYDLPGAPAKPFLDRELIAAAERAKEVEKRVKAGKVTRPKLCPVRGAWRLVDTCDAALASTKTARGDEPLKGRHFYRHVTRPKTHHTAVKVGSADIDTSQLKCKVLIMSSCSSHVHFFKALARRRKKVKSDCKLYMTGQVCSATLSISFLKLVFKGRNPVSKTGRKKFLKAMNGEADSGVVGIY
jgi:hypothetical protein